ncbi:unnamed protein product [Diplocarpon coronariae]|uniref:Urea amidolyase-like protein n=1 Tax=Diplocarpon coronariae TaxID=2795749 RepID=A0A218Z491_9HELO|nr:urea amidolyase-like protein [Marssonina coronariae]
MYRCVHVLHAIEFGAGVVFHDALSSSRNPLPPLRASSIKVKKIQAASDRLLHQMIDRVGFCVERWPRRAYDGASTGDPEGLHATWDNNHAVGAARATGDRRSLISAGANSISVGAYVCWTIVAFVTARGFGPLQPRL